MEQLGMAIAVSAVQGVVGTVLTIDAVDGSHVDDGSSIDDVAQLRAEAVHAAGKVDANDSVPFLIENVTNRA
jgi:hypothetical protein